MGLGVLNLASVYPYQLWPLAVYFGLVVVTVAAIIGISHVLGQRHHDRDTDEPYEGGMPPTGSARLRMSAKFYLVAMFFVIFDLEAIFIFAWAISVRQLGWPGFVAIVVFIGVLIGALIYLWRMGALDWAGGRRKGG
jgi:NADH-quinone oxidoreductase subunit A